MSETTSMNNQKSWHRKLRGGTDNITPLKLIDAMVKSSKEKRKSQKVGTGECLVDSSKYLDLFAMATQAISAETNYFSAVKMMTEDEEGERRPPCNLSKVRESNCKLDYTTREDLYKLVMRVVNSTSLLEERHTGDKMTKAGTRVTSQEMRKQLQGMLEVASEEYRLWEARLATTAKYQKTLVLTIHYAVGLPSADQNGFSDPYCQIGLVLPRDKSTLCKQLLKSLADPGQIEKSTIQKKTLDPVWEEVFEFPLLEQPQVVMIDVWDDDVEQQNETKDAIKGFRGLKYKINDFINKEDDFLGKCYFNINTLPNEKTQHVLQLYGKNMKDKKGIIRISTEIQVRIQDSELESLKSDGYALSLFRSFLIESVRHQYAKHVDVNGKDRMKDIDDFLIDKVTQLLQMDEFSQAVARLGSSAQYLIGLSYEREKLKGYLEEIIQNWDRRHASLRNDVMEGVMEDIESVYSHDLCLLKQSRVRLPPNSAKAQSILKQVIQTIIITFNFLKKIERIDTKLELKNVIESSIKVDIHSWYEVMNAKPLQRIDDGDISTLTVRVSTLTNLCAEVAEDLITVHTLYQEAFAQIGLSYFDVAYQTLDEILSLEISSLLSSTDLKRYFEQIAAKDKRDSEEKKREQFTFAIKILKFYKNVKDIHQFNQHINSEDYKALKYKFEDYQAWFKPCVLSWMDLARNISMGTVMRAIEIDTREVIQDNKIKVTSSAIDIAMCFEQCYQFYHGLSWSHVKEGELVIAKIVQMICETGKLYSTQMHKILNGDLERNDKKPVEFELNNGTCVCVNNIQIVLEYMREIPKRLNWEKLLEESKDNEEIVEKWRKIVDNSINEIKNDKSSMLQEIIVEFTKQFKVYFNGFMKKPQDEPIDDAIDVLMNWFANNLEVAWSTLMGSDFQLLLEWKWHEIVMICSGLQKQKSKQHIYCTRMAAAVDIFYRFLHVDGNGLKEEDLQTDSYKQLNSTFCLYRESTEKLIAMYCNQLTEENKTVERKYGSLTFSVYHLEKDNVLKVKLIKGENLPKMDIHGSCDPYIKFRTLPKLLFEEVKTKYQSNTQNPNWEIDFKFRMCENPSSIEGACLQLSLYDHDKFSEDDYGGSVYIAINKIAKSNEEAIETTSNIMFPIDTPILSMLNDRSDKIADKFSKQMKNYLDAESVLSSIENRNKKSSKK